MAPYCAIPRDYLSDTPLLRAMGFLVSQHGQLGAIPPPPFLSVSPPGEHSRSGGAIPLLYKRGILRDTGAIPYENKAKGCDTPLCDTILKGYCTIGGGVISHWARDFPRSYRAPPSRTCPSGTDPPPGPDLDLIWTRFRPDFDLKSAFSGPNQVEIGSKSGPNQVRAEGSVPEG